MATKLRRQDWAPICRLDRIDYGLLLPIVIHYADSAAPLSPAALPSKAARLLREAYHDIPIVVPAIREYWMPQRVAEIR
jgi:uncharacterized protein